MSNRRRILLIVLGLAVATVVVRYGLGAIFPDHFAVDPPEVSVRAEPVFSIDGNGIHFGPAMFETESHHPEGFVITNAMIMSTLVVIVLAVLSWLATRRMDLVPRRRLQNIAEIAVDGMYNTFGSIDRKYIARFWPLVGTIFFYVLFSNWLALIPGVLSAGYRIDPAVLHGEEHAQIEQGLLAHTGASDQLQPSDTVLAQEPQEDHETVVVPFLRSPSADLSNTLMLGLVAFLFTEFWGFRTLGLGYLYKFFPYKDGVIMMLSGFLELISEFVRIVAFTFRLFGNIFAGEVLLLVMTFLFPLLPLPFIGFELFVGFIQAFVFAVLAMAFSSMATQGHGDHAGHDEPHHAEVGGTTRQNPVH